VLGRGPGSRLLPVRACPLSFTVPPGKAAHGRLPERPKGAVCKIAGMRLRWFEPNTCHA
jgi:hypothetical protein